MMTEHHFSLFHLFYNIFQHVATIFFSSNPPSPSTSETTIGLLSLPPHLLFKIIDRMNTVSLCRMRQTCHLIDDFVEKHRFLLSRRRPDSQWILKIWNKKYTGTGYGFSGQGFCITTNFDGSKYGRKEFLFFPRYEKNRLNDPFMQLSAVSLKAVEVFDYVTSDDHPAEMRLTYSTLDLLQKLRLDVEWLSVMCKFTPELSAAVRFSKLWVESNNLTLSALKSAGLQNCRELKWFNRGFSTFKEFILILDHLETVTLHWLFASEECKEMFLTELMEYLKNEARTLRRIRIFRRRDINLHLNGLSLMCSFRDLKVYKCNIRGGVAYFRSSILLAGESLDIRLFEKESRMSLLETVLQSEPGLKDPAIINPFMEAADETKALETLRNHRRVCGY